MLFFEDEYSDYSGNLFLYKPPNGHYIESSTTLPILNDIIKKDNSSFVVPLKRYNNKEAAAYFF